MRKTMPLLAAALLFALGTAAAAAAEPAAPPAASSAATQEGSKPDEPAKCPIKKTIDGKLYCFQNDPALTKPQGGD
jgi:hypothetical protein